LLLLILYEQERRNRVGRLHKPRKRKGRNRKGGWGRKTVSEPACNKANDMVNVYCHWPDFPARCEAAKELSNLAIFGSLVLCLPCPWRPMAQAKGRMLLT
jgi:hypothetical protein